MVRLNGYIEAWGRGIQKICEECELIGAKIPEYQVLGDDITVKFTAILTDESFIRTKDVRKGVRKESDTCTRILEFVTLQSDISLSEIADQLGVSYRTVQRSMADLKKKGVVVRIGGRKNGYWEIKQTI